MAEPDTGCIYAVEVADEFVRRAPSNRDAHYLRATALAGAGDNQRALADYSDTIELSSDKKRLASRVFTQMADAYAALKRSCEAVTPISLWVSFDPPPRDTSQTQKIIADYERQGDCVASGAAHDERFPLHGKNVVIVKAEINGVKGSSILDTSASYVSVRSEFADRAKIPQISANEITLITAHGETKAILARADRIKLGSLQATGVPVPARAARQRLRTRHRRAARHELPVPVRGADRSELRRGAHAAGEKTLTCGARCRLGGRPCARHE